MKARRFLRKWIGFLYRRWGCKNWLGALSSRTTTRRKANDLFDKFPKSGAVQYMMNSSASSSPGTNVFGPLARAFAFSSALLEVASRVIVQFVRHIDGTRKALKGSGGWKPPLAPECVRNSPTGIRSKSKRRLLRALLLFLTSLISQAQNSLALSREMKNQFRSEINIPIFQNVYLSNSLDRLASSAE